MNTPFTFAPYGQRLVNLLVDEERASVLKQISVELPDVVLDERRICDLEMLATGAFSPLKGFMTRIDYEAVLDRMQLQDGTLWPLPVCLDVPDVVGRSIEAGDSVALRDPEGYLLAVMDVEDVWPVDREKEAQSVYESIDSSRAEVGAFFKSLDDVYLGGRLEVVNLPLHLDFRQLRLSAADVRRWLQKLGWQRVIGFSTRRPLHRAGFEMIVDAMRSTKANLLLMAMEGMEGVGRSGDFDHYTRVRCHREVSRHLPPDSCLLNLLPHATRSAGIRSEILNAIVSRNYGCTHCVARQGEGGVELEAAFEQVAREVGVTILPRKSYVYLPFEDEYRPLDQVPAGTQSLHLTHEEIRERIRRGRGLPEWATFPEVAAELRRVFPPPPGQGLTVFLTGLSGAGKSTIAKILYARFLEIGGRPVSLLDGDIVRRHLSSELSFTKEHRDINVRRIGFVAGEITKNRGIAICAPIAPYARTRAEIRRTIETTGGFIEVHVATPLEECERRDRKGIYARARAGLIKGFTGIDDPYEVPESPEVRIDTTDLTPDEAAQEVLLYLAQQGYI